MKKTRIPVAIGLAVASMMICSCNYTEDYGTPIFSMPETVEAPGLLREEDAGTASSLDESGLSEDFADEYFDEDEFNEITDKVAEGAEDVRSEAEELLGEIEEDRADAGNILVTEEATVNTER